MQNTSGFNKDCFLAKICVMTTLLCDVVDTAVTNGSRNVLESRPLYIIPRVYFSDGQSVKKFVLYFDYYISYMLFTGSILVIK